MTDIVERLRQQERDCGGILHGPICAEAADEIERLREKFIALTNHKNEEIAARDDYIERLRRELKDTIDVNNKHVDEIEAQSIENLRLQGEILRLNRLIARTE